MLHLGQGPLDSVPADELDPSFLALDARDAGDRFQRRPPDLPFSERLPQQGQLDQSPGNPHVLEGLRTPQMEEGTCVGFERRKAELQMEPCLGQDTEGLAQRQPTSVADSKRLDRQLVKPAGRDLHGTDRRAGR